MQIINYFYYKNKNLEIKNSKDNTKSHNTMSTFFSGTDTNTLLDEGKDQNHFVSLIVNNKGEYTAAITKKVSRKIIGTVAQVYNTFNNVPVIQGDKDFETTNTVIEYYMLDITIEHPVNEMKELSTRLEEVKNSNEAYINRNRFTNISTFNASNSVGRLENGHYNYPKEKGVTWHFNNKNVNPSAPVQQSLFGDDNAELVRYDELHVSTKLLLRHAATLLTGNIFIGKYEPEDVERYAEESEALYANRFTNDNSVEFTGYADQIIETICPEVLSDKLNDEYEDDYVLAIWAYDLTVMLEQLNPNKYIKYYIDSLAQWII